jgi:hypothetical protein
MNTESTTLTPEQRQQIWNELAAEEASGIPSTQPSEAAVAALAGTGNAAPGKSAEQAQPVESTGTTAPTEDTKSERFASLPQDVRDYLAGLEDTVSRLGERMRSTEGSIGGLKSALNRQREAAQAVRDAGGSAPTEQQLQQAQAGGQRAMDRLKETYPEFAETLGEVLNEELAQLRAAQQAKADPAHEQQAPALSREEEIALAKREAYIEGKGFKDWQKQIGQPEFIGWFNRQPREIQMLGHSPNWDDSVRLLEIHREQMQANQQPAGEQPGRGSERLLGLSALHQTRQRGGFQGVKSVDQMTPQEYWAHLNAIDAQQNKG